MVTKLNTLKKIQLIIALCASTLMLAQDNNTTSYTTNRPDGHAPISVMGDHTHNKGEWMVSYRFSTTTMGDLRRANDDVTNESVLLPNGGDYMVTPTEMPMNMHMIGAMYAPTDRLTLMAMGMYMDMTMDHLTAMGGMFTTESSGFGDLSVSAMYKFIDTDSHKWHAQIGLSIPTGTIDNKDVTPASMGNEVILPYPMQIGSGTYDAITAVTYLGQSDYFSWGSQLRGVFRTGENENDYRLGNQLGWNNWIAYRATNWLSVSGRLQGLIQGGIRGANPDLNPAMVITADTSNSGYDALNAGFGFNIYAPELLKGARLGFEYALPLQQNLNGVQLKNQDVITVGLQYSF